jgi:hypothetical protein
MDKKLIMIAFSVFTFLVGFYYYATIERFEPKRQEEKEESCPDLLIRKGGTLLLYNTKDSASEPLPFYNIDEYINYLEIQRRAGKQCPVLFLQYENTAQGTDVYRMRPSPFDLQGGVPPNIDPTLFQPSFDPMNIQSIDGQPIKVLDANRDNGYNQNMFAGFDPHGIHVGQRTELDAIHESTSAGKPESENPMDYNWGGVQVTENEVRSGNYVDRYVSKPLYFTPKTTYLPDIYGAGERPPSEVPDALKPQYE